MSARQTLDQRLVRAQRRMASGSLEGRSEQAQPIPARPRATAVLNKPNESIVFGSIGDVVVADSGEYEVLIGGRAIRVIANLSAALTGTTTILVKKNRSTVSTVTLGSGVTRVKNEETGASAATSPTDILTVSSTAVGTGSAIATVQVILLG